MPVTLALYTVLSAGGEASGPASRSAGPRSRAHSCDPAQPARPPRCSLRRRRRPRSVNGYWCAALCRSASVADEAGRAAAGGRAGGGRGRGRSEGRALISYQPPPTGLAAQTRPPEHTTPDHTTALINCHYRSHKALINCHQYTLCVPNGHPHRAECPHGVGHLTTFSTVAAAFEAPPSALCTGLSEWAGRGHNKAVAEEQEGRQEQHSMSMSRRTSRTRTGYIRDVGGLRTSAGRKH